MRMRWIASVVGLIAFAGLCVMPGYASAATGPLSPNLDVGNASPRSPHTFDFNTGDSSGGGETITDYRLDFGDGRVQDLGTAVFASHSFGADGPYTVTLTITDSTGRTASVSRVVVAGGVYWQTGPFRELDTRTFPTDPSRGIGPRQVKELPIFGDGLLEGHTTALILNVTVTEPSTSGFVSVYPAGTPRPATSSINFAAGQTVANMVTVPYTGAVDIYNSSGRTDVVVDLIGSYVNEGAINSGLYTGITPTRVLDTRIGLGAPKAVLRANSVLKLPVGATPALQNKNVTAVALNVTAVGPSVAGYLTVYPTDQQRQPVSTVNFARGQTAANLTITPVGSDGLVSIYNPFGTINVVVDVEGYFSPTSGSPFVPVAPQRVLDTRSGLGAPAGAVGPGRTVALAVAGAHGIPAQVGAVLLNLTATEPSTSGYLTAYPDGTTRPSTSSVNFVRAQTVANEQIVGVGNDGKVAITNASGTTQIVADLSGYYAGVGPQTPAN